MPPKSKPAEIDMKRKEDSLNCRKELQVLKLKKRSSFTCVMIISFIALFFSTAVYGADKQYAYTLDYSALPADIFKRQITINVSVGTASSTNVTADGSPIICTYTASTGTCSFSLSKQAASLVVTAVNWTAGGTGAATKATLLDNRKWAYSFTFDDCYASDYTLDLPYFSARNMRAGVGVVTNWIGGGSYLSRTQLDALFNAGWSILNHSTSHPQSTISCSNLATYVGAAKTTLESWYPNNYKNIYFIYPYLETGYQTCLSTAGYFSGAEDVDGTNYVDTFSAIGWFNLYRHGMYANISTSQANAWADTAASDARPRWMITFTHQTYAGSSTPGTYDTNEATLQPHINYVYTTYGDGGTTKNMWFAPSDEVLMYLFTRQYLVINAVSVPTPTNTPSMPTPTRSRTTTFTMTSTPTSTGTFTQTPSYSRTATLTFTRTISPSPTNTLVNTATFTATRTNSASPTASFSSTNTPANTATPANTPVNTATLTATRISSPTSTVNATNTPANTATLTGTAMNTATNTPVITPTNSSTAQATQTYTPRGTATEPASMTPSAVFTNTGSRTSTPVLTMTNTPVFSTTSTQVNTPTYTMTVQPSFTATKIPTLTYTVTPSATATASQTAVQTGTFTRTVTRTATPTYTTTIPAPTATNTAVIGDKFEINNPVIYPNPYSLHGGGLIIGMDLTRPADRINIRIYTVSYRQIADITESGYFLGRVKLPVPDRYLDRLANGIYYMKAAGEGYGNEKAVSKPVQLIILR